MEFAQATLSGRP